MASGSTVSIISRQTQLTGRITSEDVLIIAGRIEGDIAGNKVIIKDQGRVLGNINCASLVIEAGGIFDGQASMSTSDSGESSDS